MPSHLYQRKLDTNVPIKRIAGGISLAISLAISSYLSAACASTTPGTRSANERVSKLFATGKFWWYSESREEQALLGSSLERNWGESEAKVRRNRNKPATRLTTKSRSKTVNIQIRVVPTRNNSTLYQPNIIFLFDECPFFVSSTYRFLLAYIYSVFYPDFLSIFIRSNNGQTNSVLIIEKKYEIIGKLERWSMCVRIGKSRSYWKIHRYER